MQRNGSLFSVGGAWSEGPLADVGDQELGAEELRVTTIHSPPYIIVRQLGNGSYSYGGLFYDIWEIITSELGLNYRITPLLEGGYGSLNANGTWTGMVGEMVYGRADVALTGLFIREDRAAVIDYIDAASVSQGDNTFYVPRGGSTSMPTLSLSLFNSLLKPLHPDVWWLLLVSLLLVSVVLRYTVKVNHDRTETRQTVEEMTWGSCLLSSFMTIASQGWVRTPDSLAARITTLASWILGMLICYNYTANLISYLTFTTVSKPINSLQEFFDQPDWVFSVQPGMGIMNDWKVSANIYERKLYMRTVTGDKYVPLDLKIDTHLITHQQTMTYTDSKKLFYNLGSEACELVPLFDTPPRKTDNFLVIAKGRRKIKQAINDLMRKLSEKGVLQRLKNKWLSLSRDMCDSNSGFREMSFGDVLPVLVILPYAMALSITVLTLEWVFTWIRSWRQQQSLSWSQAGLIG